MLHKYIFSYVGVEDLDYLKSPKYKKGKCIKYTDIK